MEKMARKKGNKSYYIINTEWNYPEDENGRGIPWDSTYDSIDDAVKSALYHCQTVGVEEFEYNTKMDSLNPEVCYVDGKVEGVIVTSRMGLDDWYFFVRIIEVNHK